MGGDQGHWQPQLYQATLAGLSLNAQRTFHVQQPVVNHIHTDAAPRGLSGFAARGKAWQQD